MSYRTRHHHSLAHVAVILVAMALPVAPGLAAEPTFGPPHVQEIVYETRHQFYVRGYRQPVIVDPATLTLGEREPTASPDVLALRALALRARGDVDTYRDELMSEALRARVAEDSLEELSARWRDTLRGVHAELTHHVRLGLDVLIHYRLVDPSSGEERGEGSFLFGIAEEDGTWRLIESDKPILVDHWRFDGPTHAVEVESIPNRGER